jgi:hypothetical protein
MKIGVRAVAGLVLATAACGQATSTPDTQNEPSSDAKPAPSSGLDGPPPLVLQRPEGDVDLPAYAWCFFDTGVGGCADGPEPANPPQTSAEDPLTFSFPLEGWTFTAAFRQPGPYAECERTVQIDAVASENGVFVVSAPVPAGEWVVQIRGNGQDGGSLATALGWTVATGFMAPPTVRGEALFLGPPAIYNAGDGDDVLNEVYGPSLALTGLASDPREATGALVLSDADGEMRYPLQIANDDCPRDGNVVMTSKNPNEPVDLSDDLGDPPYSYEVRLILDGEEHVGSGQWPDDLNPGKSNQLRLAWSPPLPAANGSP